LFEKRSNAAFPKVNRSIVGRLYFFEYLAKGRKELPYHDRIPLVIPIKKETDGILGINLHYLSPVYRARLFDALLDVVAVKDEDAQFKIKYDVLDKFSKFKYFRPCVKKYLLKGIRTSTLIPPTDWQQALFLPVEDFRGPNSVVYPRRLVWEDSRDLIKKRP